MGRNCETATTKMERVAPDGRYWIQARGDAGVTGTEYPKFFACMKEQFAKTPYREWVKKHSASPQTAITTESPTATPQPSTTSQRPAQTSRALSERIKFARFVASVPPAGTRLRGDLSNAPPPQTRFDAQSDTRVLFLYGIINEKKPLNVQIHWLDPSNGLFSKSLNVDDPTSSSDNWKYYISALATSRMLRRPGTWKVQLWMDEQLAGEYAFELVAQPSSPLGLSARAEEPKFQVGDRWVRSDGVFEVAAVDRNRVEYLQGTTRRLYTLISGELERLSEAGTTLIEYNPPFPVLQFPLTVGKQWEYRGHVRNQVTGFSGPITNKIEVVDFEDVLTAAGTFPAFKIVSGNSTYWYSPSAKTIVRQLFGSASVFRDFELVVFDPSFGRLGQVVPSAPAATRVIGGALTPQDLKPYYSESWAVVIGINQYRSRSIPRLQFAIKDAEAIVDALPRLGFPSTRTVVLEDSQATKSAIERAIYGSMSQMGKDDRLFVFFAGHGETLSIRGGQEGYLLPFDADPSNLPLTALPMTDLAQIGRRLPLKHVLFVLDNCFSGYATKRDAGGSVQGADLTALTNEPVVQILTAGTQGQAAIEEGGHGLFTRHLLKGLEGWADPDGRGLTALKLATFVQERVVNESRGQQTPQYGKLAGEGEFLFRPPRR
jgi:hypothetical protein